MAEKKDEPDKKSAAAEEDDVTKVRIVGGPEPEAIAHRRSDSEQSIIDSYGTDPSKHKEGSRERQLVESLPENIAKKREEEAKKKK